MGDDSGAGAAVTNTKHVTVLWELKRLLYPRALRIWTFGMSACTVSSVWHLFPLCQCFSAYSDIYCYTLEIMGLRSLNDCQYKIKGILNPEWGKCNPFFMHGSRQYTFIASLSRAAVLHVFALINIQLFTLALAKYYVHWCAINNLDV